jgi:hypothetical protein
VEPATVSLGPDELDVELLLQAVTSETAAVAATSRADLRYRDMSTPFRWAPWTGHRKQP